MTTPDDSLFVVRLWDGFDGEWLDVFGPSTREKCEAEWDRRTDHGKKNTTYQDIDYYKMFPASTRMQFSEGRSMIHGG